MWGSISSLGSHPTREWLLSFLDNPISAAATSRSIPRLGFRASSGQSQVPSTRQRQVGANNAAARGAVSHLKLSPPPRGHRTSAAWLYSKLIVTKQWRRMPRSVALICSKRYSFSFSCAQDTYTHTPRALFVEHRGGSRPSGALQVGTMKELLVGRHFHFLLPCFSLEAS